MFARFPNGTGTLFAVLGAFVAFAPCLGSGCGGSPTATAPQPDASLRDAGVVIGTVGHVITAGGGAAMGGSSGSVTNPFGGSSSSGSPDDSGSTNDDSGVVSDDGSMADGPSSGDGSGGQGDGGGCSAYPPLVCGGGPCDLSSHTCCVTVQLAERCLAGTGAVCNSKEASVHCTNACDCPTGQSCCGTIDLLSDSVQSTCQPLNPSVSGGNCPPYPATVSQTSGQLCFVDSECQNGQGCIYQTCVYGAQFHICGLQSQSPFNCVATPAGDGG